MTVTSCVWNTPKEPEIQEIDLEVVEEGRYKFTIKSISNAIPNLVVVVVVKDFNLLEQIYISSF